MKFLVRFVWDCKTIVVPLVANIAIITILYFAGYYDAAWMLGYFGPLIIMLANLVYIALLDSRKRWPNTPWHGRLANVLTFKR